MKSPAHTVSRFSHLTPVHAVKTNLYLSNSLETFVSGPDLKRLFRFQLYQLHVTKTASSSDYVDRILAWLVDNELKITSTKVVVAIFQIISRHSWEGT